MKKSHLIGFLILLLFFRTEIKAQYPFIRYDLNHIVLPKDTSGWKSLAVLVNKVKESGKGNLNFLHLGDSHIQADYFTGQVRKDLFQYLNLDVQSRGITFPYRLAVTNGPDELFSSSEGCLQYRSIRKLPKNYFALTGYNILSCDTLNSLLLRDTSNLQFNMAYVFHSQSKAGQLRMNGNIANQSLVLGDSMQVSVFMTDDLVSDVNLEIRQSKPADNLKVYGFYLLNSSNQITYNNAGINGATFGTFLQIQGSKEMIGFVKPDCVIFSYGTNDAINRSMDTSQLRSHIVQCIQQVRMILPNVPILFTTPGDHLINRKSENPRIALAGLLIKKVALENNCAYWDFYQVMGGRGSVREWYKSQLVFKDWIHLSKKGYRFQGDLFFDAMLNMFVNLNKKAS